PLSLLRSEWHKSFGDWALCKDFFLHAEPLFRVVLQPQQHTAEGQLSQVDPPTALAWLGQHLPVQPGPDVAEEQSYPDVQQPQQRVARAGANPRLVQLPVAGLDAEPLAVRLLDPLRRRRLRPPAPGIHQRLATVPAALATPVATLDADAERGRGAVGGGHRVLPPAAPLPGAEYLAAAGPLGVLGAAPSRHQRHQPAP